MWKGWASLRARVSEKRQRQILAQNLALASQSQPVLSADREYKEPWKNWFHCNCSMRPGRLKHKAGAASSCLPSSPGLPTGPHVWIKALAMLSVLWEERFRKGKRGGKKDMLWGCFLITGSGFCFHHIQWKHVISREAGHSDFILGGQVASSKSPSLEIHWRDMW